MKSVMRLKGKTNFKKYVVQLCVICSPIFVVSSWGQLQEDAPWPMFHRDVRHTGRNSHSGPSDPLLAWSYTICSALVGDPVPASAVGSDGMVYAGAYNNLLTFNPDGALTWSFLTGAGGRTSPPALGSDGKVYVGGHDGYFRAIGSDGKQVWRTGLGICTNSGAVIGSDGTIYVGGGSGSYRCYALNSDGSTKWSYRVANTVSCSSALGSDERVYVGSLDNRLYALNSNGTLGWSYLAGRYVASSPALGSDEKVYVGSSDNRLYAISSVGTLHWSFVAGNRINCSPVLGNYERLYVGSSDYRLYALNSDGTLCWSYPTDWYVVSAPALGGDERVYVGSEDNSLYAFDLNGALSWSYLTGDCVDSALSMGRDGEIFFGSDDLVFYCIKQAPSETSTPTETPPPTASSAPTATPTVATLPLAILPGELTVGQSFTIDLALNKNIAGFFDYYMFIDTIAGFYTISLNGRIQKGLEALYKDVPKFNAPYSTKVRPTVRVPISFGGETVTFYALVMQSGKKPSVDMLTGPVSANPYVIMMDKKSVKIKP